jgi:lysozyme family protein
MPNNDQILTDILRREGGLSNDPADPGGLTNFGLTTACLSEYYGRTVGANEVETLTAAVARTIYADMYIEKPGFNLISVECLRGLLVDSAVNNGRGRAIKWLQTALGVVPDGVLGPRTIAALTGNWGDIYYKVLRQRFECYSDLPRVNAKLMKFLPGWIKRANEFVVKVG